MHGPVGGVYLCSQTASRVLGGSTSYTCEAMPLVSAPPLALWSLVGLLAAMSVTGRIETVRTAPDGHGVHSPAHRVVDLGDRVNAKTRLAIDLRGTESADVVFAPVRLAVGESYSMDWRTESGQSLGRFDLVQTSATTTLLGFYTGDTRNVHEQGNRDSHDPTVRISTIVDGETTHGFSLTPTTNYLHLGVVTSPRGPWAATWHYVCHGDTCSLRIDPEDTTIEFRGQDLGAVPFEVVAVDVADPGVRGVELLLGRLW